MLLAVIGDVTSLPAVAFDPLHAPEAVQAVASVEDQVSVLVAPGATATGLALSVTVGAGVVLVTVTVADFDALPPAPVHVKVNVLFTINTGVVATPVVVRSPLHAPDALQLVAWVDDQVRVDVEPLTTCVGFAVNVTVGATVEPTVTVTLLLMVLPSTPRHAKVNRVVAVNPEITWEPDSAFRPFHASEPQHNLVPVVVQVNVVLPPLTTDVGLAENVIDGDDAAVTVIVTEAVARPPDPSQVSV